MSCSIRRDEQYDPRGHSPPTASWSSCSTQTGPVDFVYHLAAEFGRINGEEYYETLWQTNVIGTRNILELQRRHGFKLIFASSSEIYGDRHEEILHEAIPLQRSIIQHNDYATTKWVNEVQIMNFEKRYDSPIVRLRFFNAYGPGEYYHNYRSVVCLFCYRALHDQPYTVYRGLPARLHVHRRLHSDARQRVRELRGRGGLQRGRHASS